MRRFLLVISIIIFHLLLVMEAGAQTNQTVTNGGTTTATTFPGGGCIYNWVNDTPGIGLAAGGTGSISSFTAVNRGSSPVIATITATPVSSGFAYITNSSSNNVSVISTATHAIVATISAGNEPWGVAVSPDGSRVYVTNANDNTTNPYPGNGTLTVINTLTNTVVATIGVGGTPLGVAVSPDGSRVFVTNTNDGTISVIDAKTNTVISIILVYSPDVIVVSPDGTRLYVSSDWGAKPDVYVIDLTNNSTVADIPINSSIRGLAISPNGGLLYVTLEYLNEVKVVNTVSNAVVKTIPLGYSPNSITVSPDGSRAYTANPYAENVSVINTATNAVIATIPVAGHPYGISVSPDGKEVYIANEDPDAVSVINTVTNQVIYSIPAGASPVSRGNFVSAGIGCNSTPITFTITVNPSPSIVASPATGNISACAGTASASPNIQQFTVSGNNLTEDITATAPPGFEVSLIPGSGYSNSVALTQSAGFVANSTVYVRSSATASSGNISGNVNLSTAGAPDQTVAVKGIINASPTISPVPNQTVAGGSTTNAVSFTGTGGTFIWENDTPAIGLAANGTGDIGPFIAKNSTGAPVTATITVREVFADIAYIADSGNTVAAINTVTNKVIANIAVGSVPFAAAVSPDGSRVYVANLKSANVSVINTATNKVIATITVGIEPYALAFSPDGGKLYVVNNVSNNVSVINTATNTVQSTIAVNVDPTAIAISPDGSRVYVSNYDSGTVSVINTVTNAIIYTISVGGFASGIALSLDGSVAYILSVNTNTLTVVNTTTFAAITKFTVGWGAAAVVVSPDGSTLYESNPDDYNVWVIDAATYKVIAKVPVGKAPEGISLNADGSLLYVANNNESTVSVISTISNTLVNTINTGKPVEEYPGNFIMPYTGCPGAPVTFTITVTPPPVPTISTSGSPSILTTTYGTPSTSSAFTVSGSNTSAGILIGAPPGFEVSTDNINFSSSVTLGTAGTVAPAIVYVRLAATTAAGSITGDIVLSSTGAAIVNVIIPVSFVTPATLTITPNNANKTYGTVLMGVGAGSTGFTSTGLHNAESVGSVTITYGAGAAKTDNAGTYTGSVTASTAIGTFLPANYTIIYLPGDIIVAPVPLTIIADDKIKVFGDANPVLTAGYIGFVNNDGPAQLTNLPVITTNAVTTSPVGEYPITASAATAQNYTITYLPGVLTVELKPATIIIPNTFTPNGDGINDNWMIKNIEFYPNCAIEIYNRYGENVYSSIGYGIPWNGTYKSTRLPTGTYYYIIDLKNKSKVISGFVAIIR